MKSPKWLREAKSKEWFKAGALTPYTAKVQVAADGKIKSWKEMAKFLGMDERTLRTAYKEDANVRGFIFKTAGRYWSYDLWLGYMYGDLMNRREGWPHRSARAAQQKRRRGQFKK